MKQLILIATLCSMFLTVSADPQPDIEIKGIRPNMSVTELKEKYPYKEVKQRLYGMTSTKKEGFYAGYGTIEGFQSYQALLKNRNVHMRNFAKSQLAEYEGKLVGSGTLFNFTLAGIDIKNSREIEFNGEGLSSMSFFVDASSMLTIIQALKTKFPMKCEVSVSQNLYGAQFNNEECSYFDSYGNGMLVGQRTSSDLTQGYFLMESKSKVAERETRSGKEQMNDI